MKMLGRLLFLATLIALLTSFKPLGGSKAAYKAHFRGTILYAEGKFKNAEAHFRRAYESVPDNFNFAMALAVCMGHNGQPDKGIKLLKKSSRTLSPQDPEYDQKKVLSHFFEAMIQIYAGKNYKAIPLLQEAITLQKPMQNTHLMSIFLNALGYATMMDQGRGSHRKAGLDTHYHVHKRDMLKAQEYFKLALEYDGRHEEIVHNYEMLTDSLQLEKNVQINRLRINDKEYVSSSYKYLPANILRALDMANYEEVIFLLDISGSMVMEKVTCMGVDRFAVMKETTLFLLETLDSTVQIGIGTVGGDCGTTPRLWIKPGELNRTDLRWSIDFLVPDGTTPLLNMLKDTPDLFSDNPQTKKSIFLVSDGANICKAQGEGICEWAENLSNISINIFTFLDTELNNIDPFAEYTCLADNTNGKILYLDNNRCSVEYFVFQLVEECLLQLPKVQKVNCWGKSVKNLWAIFPE